MGCFVAAAASLMGTSYTTALHSLGENIIGRPPAECLQRLHRVGFRTIPTNRRRIASLRKRAMIILRWRDGLGHTVLWDPSRKRIIDPATRRPWTIASYERHLHRIYYV